jgi:hypothetical protein
VATSVAPISSLAGVALIAVALAAAGSGPAHAKPAAAQGRTYRGPEFKDVERDLPLSARLALFTLYGFDTCGWKLSPAQFEKANALLFAWAAAAKPRDLENYILEGGKNELPHRSEFCSNSKWRAEWDAAGATLQKTLPPE